jgi:hypothetical protein
MPMPLPVEEFDPRNAELLFQIITEREERTSIAIATNLPSARRTRSREPVLGGAMLET